MRLLDTVSRLGLGAAGLLAVTAIGHADATGWFRIALLALAALIARRLARSPPGAPPRQR